MCPLCGRSFIFIWHRCLCILLLERLLKNYCNQVNMMFIHNMTCKMPFYNQNIQCVSFMSLFIILDASKACVKIGKFWDRRSLIFVLLPWIFRKNSLISFIFQLMASIVFILYDIILLRIPYSWHAQVLTTIKTCNAR